MSRRLRVAGFGFALLLAASCGAGSSTPRAASSSPAATTPTPSAPGPIATPTTTPATASTTKATSAPKASPGGSTTGTLHVPGSGAYVYDQTGSEKFCTTTCSTQTLPPTRTMSLTMEDRTSDAVTLAFAGQVSKMRYTRDAFRFTRARAQLLETYVRFSYRGAEFENAYAPDPPFDVVRFPIASGASWSGSWQADTYGTYTVDVGARESVNVGGNTVKAFRVHIVTTFTGDADGNQDLTVWIDPATNATVRTAGSLSARTFLGRYETTFDATLRSAPGY